MIDMLGAGVEGWAVGQRVGVGFLGGSCGRCEPCRGGDLVNCRNQEFTGVQHDGGYAEVLIAKASGLMSIPDDLSAVDAAPLLCAGLTTFSALRNAPAKAGDLVAVLGIGGLGHLGVQYARHMGFEVAAIGRGSDKSELARKLGAHHYIDSSSADPGQALQELGGAALVIVTASAGKAAAQVMKGLRPRGRIIALGATPDPIEVSTADLLFGNRSIEGALTGDPATGDATLKFSVLTGVAAMIETMPLEQAPEAYAKMMAGKARFRMVLSMQSLYPGTNRRRRCSLSTSLFVEIVIMASLTSGTGKTGRTRAAALLRQDEEERDQRDDRGGEGDRARSERAVDDRPADHSAERIRDVEGRDVGGRGKLRRGLAVFHDPHLHRRHIGEGRDAEDEGGGEERPFEGRDEARRRSGTRSSRPATG